MKSKYQIGDTISNPNLSMTVKESSLVPFGKKGRKATYYQTVCKRCGYSFPEAVVGTLEQRKYCPGCEKQPAALKTDHAGDCVTICRMGQLEYIHQLITEEDMTQQAAVESFIEAVRAHANEGDPLTSDLTVEMVRSQYRRDSGKLSKSPEKTLVESTKEIEGHSTVNYPDQRKKEIGYKCLPTVAGVQAFLNKYIPGYIIVLDESQLSNLDGDMLPSEANENLIV